MGNAAWPNLKKGRQDFDDKIYHRIITDQASIEKGKLIIKSSDHKARFGGLMGTRNTGLKKHSFQRGIHKNKPLYIPTIP